MPRGDYLDSSIRGWGGRHFWQGWVSVEKVRARRPGAALGYVFQLVPFRMGSGIRQ